MYVLVVWVKYLKGLMIVQRTEERGQRVLVEFHLISGLSQTGVVEALTERAESSAGEQDDSLQLLVEEEIVETPDRSVLSERVGGQVWVVGIDVAAEEVNLSVESVPQLVVYLAVLAGGGDTQQIVDVVGHELKIRFFSELLRFSGREVVVWEGGVQGGNKMEESLPRYGVTQSHTGLVLGAGTSGEGPGVSSRRAGVGVAAVPTGRRAESLQGVSRPSILASKLFEKLLLRGNHLTGVALNPSNYFGVTGLEK